ncbi:MAG: 3-deoxy-D-manno-octulosonic acid transferase [Deltaproteobacteria bacterium]|nr:3-deoxy-D-manno-octulosonic acid transferase [Deltaproteobacteria bacterium]
MTPTITYLYNPLITATGMMTVPFYYIYALCRHQPLDFFKQRLGFYPPEVKRSRRRPKRVWIHAVSVGEVGVARCIATALVKERPGVELILSCTTKHGVAFARSDPGPFHHVIYYPLDLPCAVWRAFKAIRPDVYVAVETEIWPNLLHRASKMGIPALLVNGRISMRSIAGYRHIKCLTRESLNLFQTIGAISEDDAQRLIQMGADPDRVVITGNAKYESLTTAVDPLKAANLARQLNISADDTWLVAGSTRTGEEEIILDAYNRLKPRFPNLKLLLAPRHINRAEEVARLVKAHGMPYRFRTDIKPGEAAAEVIILNTMGELFYIYGLATIVICGGSMVPLGGQNLLEPAAWGKPVLYGPSMEDFLDAKISLEEVGADGLVATGLELTQTLSNLLSHPRQLAEKGAQAQLAVLRQAGAAARNSRLIADIL